MVTVTAYWRPRSVTKAFELLEHPSAVVLGGGTELYSGSDAHEVEVVDLQALHLDGIDPTDDAVRIGAMVTLQQLIDSDDVPDIVGEAARREQPSTLRAQATIGGCIARGHAESELLAALLVHEAVVRIGGAGGTEEVPLEAVLARLPIGAGRIVLAVTIRTGGVAAAARTARTSADRAIVSAYARATHDGPRFALSGVASTPVLVADADAVDPMGDFRGSREYRRALAATLLARVVEAIA